MAKNDLFNILEYRLPLSEGERISLVRKIVKSAKMGIRYCYTMKEVAGMLHLSYDQMYDAIHFFKIDAVPVLSMVRIPWWSLAEYLLDPAEDIEDNWNHCVEKYLKKKKENKK